MKKREILARVEVLEGRVVEVPSAEMDWATTVDKFKELEAKIGRMERYERALTTIGYDIEGFRKKLDLLVSKLENYKKRLTALERLLSPKAIDVKKNTG